MLQKYATIHNQELAPALVPPKARSIQARDNETWYVYRQFGSTTITNMQENVLLAKDPTPKITIPNTFQHGMTDALSATSAPGRHRLHGVNAEAAGAHQMVPKHNGVPQPHLSNKNGCLETGKISVHTIQRDLNRSSYDDSIHESNHLNSKHVCSVRRSGVFHGHT